MKQQQCSRDVSIRHTDLPFAPLGLPPFFPIIVTPSRLLVSSWRAGVVMAAVVAVVMVVAAAAASGGRKDEQHNVSVGRRMRVFD